MLKFQKSLTHSQPKNILLCGYSHDRNLAWTINKKQVKFEAVSFVKPGWRIEQVLNPYNISEDFFGQDDALVIISGANDAAVNVAETEPMP